MWQIKIIDSELDERVVSGDLKELLIEHHCLLQAGWRIYSGHIDITDNADELIANKKLLMMRPAQGFISDAIVEVFSWFGVDLIPETPPQAANSVNRSQGSATNALGQRQNTAAVGQRVDDLWGTVKDHTPRLMQKSHTRFTDNIEEEHGVLIVGAGKYQIPLDSIKDGETPFSSNVNNSMGIYGPGTWPGNGSPSSQIGTDINRLIVNVDRSNSISSNSELLPPNDLDVGSAQWAATDTGGSITIRLKNQSDLGIDLRDDFEAGQGITINDSYVMKDDGTRNLYRSLPSAQPPESFTIAKKVEINSDYVITSVDVDSIAFDYAGESFNDGNEYDLSIGYYFGTTPTGDSITTLERKLIEFGWRTTPESNPDNNITATTISGLTPIIGSSVAGAVGPIVVPEGYQTISFNYVCANGLFKYVSNTETNVSVVIRETYQELDDDGNQTGQSVSNEVTISTNERSKGAQAAITSDYDRPYEKCQVIIQRLTDRDKSSNVRANDKVILRDMYFYQDIDPAHVYPDVTMAQYKVVNSGGASGDNREIAMTPTRIFEPYQAGGTFGPESAVDTWAEVLIGIALDKYNGRLQLPDVDAEGLIERQQEMIDYYGSDELVKVGYVIDSTKTKFQDIFRIFCKAVRCEPFSLNGVYSAYPIIERTVSSKQFTHRTKIPATETKQSKLSNQYDGVEVRYRSNQTGTFEVYTVHKNGNESFNRMKIELPAAVSEKQAKARAHYEMNIIKFMKYSCQFDADGIARLTTPGERCDNVDGTRIPSRNGVGTYKVYDGYVQDVQGLVVTLSQPVTFTEGETHTIRFTNTRGDVGQAIECTKGSNSHQVILNQAVSDLYVGWKMEKSAFTFCADAERSSMPIIIKTTKPKSSDGLIVRTIKAINDDSRYYQQDTAL